MEAVVIVRQRLLLFEADNDLVSVQWATIGPTLREEEVKTRLMAAGVQGKALMALALTYARLTLLDTCLLQQVLCSRSVAQSCRVS